jgi:hypothetical protein
MSHRTRFNFGRELLLQKGETMNELKVQVETLREHVARCSLPTRSSYSYDRFGPA